MKTILMIDDEGPLCQMVQLNLEAQKRFKVHYATDPKEGLRVAKLLKPNLILLDLNMPYWEGNEVAEMLRNTTETTHIPILFFSALVDKAQVEAGGGKVSGKHFLAKPATTAELVKRIDTIIGR
jgi:DNA-binding response OmpR family regulator